MDTHSTQSAGKSVNIRLSAANNSLTSAMFPFGYLDQGVAELGRISVGIIAGEV